MATVATNGSTCIWNVQRGELETELNSLGSHRWATFSPDSQHLLVAGGDHDTVSELLVWQLTADGARRMGSAMLHPNTIQNARFSADNRFIVAGDRSGRVEMWDLETNKPIIEPFVADGGFGVTRVGINSQMSRLFAVTGWGFRLHQRSLPPRDLPVPDWFAPLAEAVVGWRVTDTGGLERVSRETLREMRARVSQLSAAPSGDDYYVRCAAWLLADHATREVAPLVAVTVPDEVEELLASGSLDSLRQAHRIQPTSARVLAALARELAERQVVGAAITPDSETESVPEWYARRAVEKAPDSVEARWSQAEVLVRLNKLDAARAAVAEASRLQPDHPSVLAVQAELARRLGRPEEASTLLDKAWSAPPTGTVSAFLEPAHVASRAGFFDAASLRNRTELRLAGRRMSLPAQFIDLTPWYTGAVGPELTQAARPSSGFEAPILGIGGVPVDLRGEVAFGTRYESAGVHKALWGVPIAQRCLRLHLLASGEFRLRVHYADQHTEELSFQNWKKWEQATVWNNPRPEVVVQSIDLLAQPNSDFVLAAITAQTGVEPVILTQPGPVNQFIARGQPLELSVATTTPGPWSFQWLAGDQVMAGATDATLHIASLGPQDFGRYQVEIRSGVVDPANLPVRSRSVWVVDAANPIVRGELNEELYRDIPGENLHDLTSSSKFPNRPDVLRAVTSLEAPPGTDDNFGRRLSGWLVPQESAEYVFYLCSDDCSRLSLSSDESPEKLVEIAKLDGYRGLRDWVTLDPESISQPIQLTAGKRYYIEVLHKDGLQGEHVSVAWRKAGEPAPQRGDAPIGGQFLARPLVSPPNGTLAAADWAIADGRTRETVPHLAAVSATNPNDTLLAMKVAALQAWFGDEPALAATRARALELARRSPNPETKERVAKICSLQAIPDSTEREYVLSLARAALNDSQSDDYIRRWCQLSVGMAAYRSGHYAEADAALVAAQEKGAGEENPWERPATAAFYRAMSLFRQGKVDESRQLAAATAARMKPYPPDEQNPLLGNINHDQLILWLAYREARALIQF